MKCPHCGKEIKRQDMAMALGDAGGAKTKEKYGRDYYVSIGKKSAKKRWG